MIEKRITSQLLEAGELALTERESAELNLPKHSTTVRFELENEEFHVQWSGRSRQLHGDMLSERLQDYGQERGLLRIRLVGEVYRLSILPSGRASEILIINKPPITTTTTTSTSKTARRRTVDRQFHADSEYDWKSGLNGSIGFLNDARELLGDQLKAAGFDPLEIVELRLQGEELATLDDFDELLAVDVANVDRMPHQEAVARHALSRLRGRAVLADEVGLGKTIEAGLAIKELTLRGLAKRVLILCPAPLREQWREEMNHKFDLTFDVALNGREVGQQDKLILTLNLGTRAIDKLAAKPWDIVIVDEAHRAAGKGAKKTRELVTALTTACRYAFFLTATPVQNDLEELYRLVELLRPGTFHSLFDFKQQFMKSSDPRTPNDPAALRRLISNVMIRTTRAQAGVDRVQRRALDVPVDLGRRERELYALTTDLLRNVMRDSGDAMRRRSLALRLTASPFSMGTTAIRMAEHHPNPRVRSVLNDIGHLAMDIQGSAREDKALEITRGWVREHGRVLIFTQHTDTVVGLLRRMDAEGLQARSFHGSLSPSERAKTIAAFRSGEAPVMISTDAGAEGQNLQFCNCVLNFDLPWNPMRIEQRIGRVDRLTQPKDEVFVANLYARNTIDESVYQLLALKLRMFELLFGQVTTILGELDDSKSASFESRVMEALFADDDSKMHGLLTQLGTELAQARDRASTLIATDSNLSNWMAAAFEHRKDLTKAGSSELVPEVSERTRMRQRRVQTWTRKVLTALDARFLHDTGEGEGAFLTAEFDEEYAEELGGRTVMHLAFDRFGLDQHPDAELCAVGSPVFDELLGLLRMRGDMHATVPVIPDDIGPSPYRHAPTLRLIRRRLIPSGTWSGQATFRATIGEAETTEHLITADVNGHNEQRLARRPLQDGETLPSAFDIPSKVIANFEKAAASQLEALRSERAKQVEEDQKRELARISAGYTAQIDEAGGDDRARLRRALASEERRLNRRPDIRARAKLLALTLDEGDWLVEETWTGPSETERGLVYEWGLPAPIVESDVSGEAIKVLTLCSGAHWVDESEVNHCGSCDEYLCGACGDDAVFVNCPLCGTSTCGACRNNTGGLCRECASPERAPELDNEFAIAWRLRAGDTLLVGERVATLVRANGTSQTVVPDEDLDDRGRRRLRSYARQNGLPLDCGLVLRDLTGRTDDQNITRVRLRTTSTVNVELTIGSMTASAVDHSAVDFLPTPSPVGVEAERDFQVGGLLKKLRDEVPPPPPPTVMVTRRSTFTDVYLEADRLVEETSTKNDGGSIKVESERIAEFQWREPSITSPLLAEAQLGQVRVALQRRNEAVLVEAHVLSHAAAPKRWAACSAGYSIADQLGCYDFLRSFGAPGGRLGMRTDGMLSIDEPFPAPTECHLVNRSIRQIAELIELESDQPLVSVDTGTLATLGVRPNKAAAQGVSALPDELNRALLSRAARPFTTAVIRGLEITEVWQGHGRATHVYKTFDGEPLLPKLDDIGFREKNFGVCRDGHFYAAGAAAFCGACQSWACRACDEIDNQISLTCPECSTSVCRRCLWTNHEVPNDRCLLCDDHACPDCGRDPQVVPCSMCCRATCESCRAGDACPACGQLVTADQSQIDELPKELALTGATVLIGADDNATVVVLNRGRAFEQAIVRDGAIHRWVAFDRGTIDNSYRLRLLASGSFEKQVVPIVQWLKAESTIDGPHLVVLSERKYHRTWSIAGDPTVRRSVSPSDTPSADLTLLTLDDFPAPTQMMPDAVEAAPPALVPILRSMAEPTTAAMTISWERSGYDLAVTPEGIADLTFQPTIDKESMAPWTDADEVPLWVIDAWDPTPSVHVYSKVRDVESVIVELASMLALGVRTADRSVWYAINASDKAPVATMLSRWLGLGDADEVGVFTDPRKLKLSHVTNANRSSVSIEPLGALHAGPQTHAGSAVEALAAWIPTAKVKAPQFQPLPPNLHSALRQSMSPLTPRSTLEIGADVEHVVTVDDGSEWRYERKLAAGQLDARRIDSITGHLLDSGVLDREGHFGVDCSTCNYCGGRTCRVCVEGLVLCTCCKTPICGRCTRSVHGILSLCPACVETRPPTRSEARQHGRFLLTRRMLIGTDAHHTVVLEKTKDEWTLHWPDGTKRPIADTSAMQFLDEQLANSGSRS